MKQIRPILLVLDTSVGAAAGDNNNSNESIKCANTLMTIKNNAQYKIYLCDECERQWTLCSSHFFISWQTHMNNKNRLLRKNPPVDNELRDKIKQLPQNDRLKLKNDEFLLESAFASGNRIVSKDNRARNGLKKLKEKYEKVKNIFWADPMKTKCLEWLNNGAQKTNKWLSLKIGL